MPHRFPQQAATPYEVVAAVDLGSNSFHLTIAKIVDGGLHTMGRLKERVQLAAGLYDDDILSDEAIMRGVSCLQMFGERLRGLPQGAVRAVGTNTLRKAKNAQTFLQLGSQALGFPIEVIDGIEEARLIFGGVAHTDAGKDKKLVIDIGGGSTELVIGTGFVPEQLSSLQMGCVAFAGAFLANGEMNREKFDAIRTQCCLELQAIENTFREGQWKKAIGTSGTIVCISDILRSSGFDDGEITRDRLLLLRETLLQFKCVAEIQLPGLIPERQNIIVPGVAILLACFERLGIESMSASNAALREGLLYELVGRFTDQDVRERSIMGIANRYHVDITQAQRVQETVAHLLEQCSDSWQLQDPELQAILGWAAWVHEIGLSISYSQMHKHGAYILNHSDIDGFSRQEKALLALLVRLHRRRFNLEVLQSVPKYWRVSAKRLVCLLRLAIILHHARNDIDHAAIGLSVQQNEITLQFRSGWLTQFPLFVTELEHEKNSLASAGITLSWR